MHPVLGTKAINDPNPEIETMTYTIANVEFVRS